MSVDLFQVAVFCLIATVLAIVLRQYRPEYAVFVSLACSILAVVYLLQGIVQVMEALGGLLENAMLPEDLLQVVVKCLGVCILTELAANTCRDAGEQAIGAKVELAGKVTLVLVSLPLFERLLQLAERLLALG